MDPRLLAMLLAVTSAGGVLGPIAHDPRLLQAEAAKRADDDAAALQLLQPLAAQGRAAEAADGASE